MSRRIVVVSAGLSVPSSTRLLADRIAAAVTAQVAARGEAADVTTIELRPLAGELADAMTTGGIPTPGLAAAKEAVSAADGVIMVTPVFATSYAGLFKLFIDTLDPDALTGTPVIVAATGGTARHSLMIDYAMRPLFAYLRAVVVPTGVFAATDDFGAAGGEPLEARITRAAEELAALVVRTDAVAGFAPSHAPARRSGVTVDPDVTPFAQLLRGHAGSRADPPGAVEE